MNFLAHGLLLENEGGRELFGCSNIAGLAGLVAAAEHDDQHSAWLTATLPSADAAADAAAEYLRLCPGMNSAECGPPEVSVAFNFGDVIISDGEYFGPAFSVLGTLMHHTRSGQILTSASTVEHLAPERRSAIHPLKSVETKHGRIELCELDWRK